jgi:hypothetical protein
MSFEGKVENGIIVLDNGQQLPEGARVEVIVVLPAAPARQRRSMLDLLATLPPGPLLFKTPEEANRYLQEERDSWER